MQDLKISLIQAGLKWEDREANLALFDGLLRNIPRETQLVVLPEMFSTGFSMNTARCAEDTDGMAVQWMKAKAKALGAVITGSLMMKDGKHTCNRLHWVHPDGNIFTCDKKHLFRFGKEDEYFAAGNKRIIVEVAGWKFCPLICYDLRFPVWSRNRYNDGSFEYDALLYVANWPDRRIHHWQTLLAARAIENMAYCIGVNRVGEDGMGLKYSGHSMVCDPLGGVISDLDPGQEGVINTVMKADLLLDWREKFGAGPDWDHFTIDSETR